MDNVAFEPQVIVYKATNLVNGHWYVGFTTKGLKYREKMHRYHRSNASVLRHAINKHGQENFTFEMLADFQGDEDLAKMYEREMIEKYRPEYNLNYGGDGGTAHPDTREKISAANKGRPSFLKGRKFSPEALAKWRATRAENGKPWGNTGKKASPEKLAKMRAAALGKPSPMKGKTYSVEVRQRMAEAARTRKPRTYTEADIARVREMAKKAHAAIRKPVRCLNDGRVFASAREACAFYGLYKNAVSKAASGETKATKTGLRFEYLTEFDDRGV